MSSTPNQSSGLADHDPQAPMAPNPAHQRNSGRSAGLKVGVGAGFSRTSYGAISLSLSMLAAGANAAPGYCVLDLGTFGGPTSFGTAINASGQVVGHLHVVEGVAHAPFAVRTNGSGMTDLCSLGGLFGTGLGINNYEQFVGASETANTNSELHAFIASAQGGAMIDLGTLGGTASYARAIHNNAIVVGSSAR